MNKLWVRDSKLEYFNASEHAKYFKFVSNDYTNPNADPKQCLT